MCDWPQATNITCEYIDIVMMQIDLSLICSVEANQLCILTLLVSLKPNKKVSRIDPFYHFKEEKVLPNCNHVIDFLKITYLLQLNTHFFFHYQEWFQISWEKISPIIPPFFRCLYSFHVIIDFRWKDPGQFYCANFQRPNRSKFVHCEMIIIFVLIYAFVDEIMTGIDYTWIGGLI